MARRPKKHANVNQDVNGKDLSHLVSEHSVLLLTISLLMVVHSGQVLQHAHQPTVVLILGSLIKTLNIQWVQFAATNAKDISISPILSNFQHVHVRMEGTDKFFF